MYKDDYDPVPINKSRAVTTGGKQDDMADFLYIIANETRMMRKMMEEDRKKSGTEVVTPHSEINIRLLAPTTPGVFSENVK